MEKITRSVIKYSEIPEDLQINSIFKGHLIDTFAIFHIDESEKEDDLTKWLVQTYPTIKRKTSFLIQIDIDIKNY